MLEFIKAIIFGIVEGITEWLPISSTGHMILLNDILPLQVSAEFLEMFFVVIQLGAIMAVVVLFWKRLFPFSVTESPWIKKDIFTMWFKIVVACIPAVIVELALGDVFEELFYNPVSVACALIVVGILFILVEHWNVNKISTIHSIADITYRTAFLIGMFQLVAAIFPGTSRSGATIIGALLLGVSRIVAAEFTFFLAVPVMFGASLIKLLKFGLSFNIQEFVILILGMSVAYIVSILSIKFLMSFVKNHDFKIFGWYRIILGAIVLIYFMIQS